MIKIVHLITDLSLGGAEIMLYKLICRMDHSKFKNVVVSMTDKGKVGEDIESLGIPVLCLGMRPGVPDPLGGLRLLKFLRKERPHIIQTWLYHADLLGVLAGKLANIPSIVWNLRCSNMDMSQYSMLSSIVVRILGKLSSLIKVVIVNSEAGLKLHKELGYGPKMWVVIPNGFDIDRFRPDSEARTMVRRELGLSDNEYLIGLVARFDPMKDHTTFLRAAGNLNSIRPDVHFVLVGNGADEKNESLMKLVTKLSLNENVHLLGERYDIPAITASFDLATCSSLSEGFPNVIGEAMACGVSCVVTNVGDAAYIVSETGLVVPPHDYWSMSVAWNKLLSMSNEERSNLGLAARERIISLFSIETIVKKYEKLYYEITNENMCSYSSV